jgi:predicted CXXCH cytochrome family protein
LACGFAAVLTLLVLPAPAAWAASPHIRSTIDTDRCAACHSVHASTAPLGSANVNARVCLGCHDGADPGASNVESGSANSFGLASGHSLSATATGGTGIAGCSTCHDSHGASADARMIPSKTVNGVAAPPTGTSQCVACHDAANSWFGPGYPSTSAPVRDAAGFPVAGTWPGPAAYASATNAHRLIPAADRTVAQSEPVRRQQGDCLYCHAAHRGANRYDGLLTTFTVPSTSTLSVDRSQGSYAALCFDCHDGSVPSGFSTAPVDIKRFATAPGGSGGHSVVTSGGTLPVGSPLPCFECHNPHGSARGNASMLSDERGGSLETSTPAGVRRFCFTCHTTFDTGSGWSSDASGYAPVSSAAKVVGISRGGGVLRLPDESAHVQADGRSCYDCHGNSYAAGGSNIHAPNASGKALVAQAAASFSAPASDTAPPITIADLTQASIGNVTLVAVDAGSGVASTHYVLDGSAPVTGTAIAVSADGTHTVGFWSVDTAGNTEATQTATFFVGPPQAASLPTTAASVPTTPAALPLPTPSVAPTLEVPAASAPPTVVAPVLFGRPALGPWLGPAGARAPAVSARLSG